MAEETPAIKNKGLLIAAFVLAAIVVLLYNFQIERAMKKARGKTVNLLVFTRHISPGDKVTADDLESREVTEMVGKGLGQVLLSKDEDSVIGMAVTRSVSKDSFVQWDHFYSGGGSGSSIEPAPGLQIYPLRVDRKRTPGALLGVGDRISAYGMLPGPDGKLTSTCIIRDVKVLGIGQEEPHTLKVGVKKRLSSRKRLRSYEVIAIEVSETVSRQLDNIRSHVIGGVGVVKLNSEGQHEDSPQITREASRFAESAAGTVDGR